MRTDRNTYVVVRCQAYETGARSQKQFKLMRKEPDKTGNVQEYTSMIDDRAQFILTWFIGGITVQMIFWFALFPIRVLLNVVRKALY
jgi:hypothetical protein